MPLGSVWICSPARVFGAARPKPSAVIVPFRPDLTGIVAVPADRSALTLTVAGAPMAIGRSETGRRSVRVPSVRVSAPKEYWSSGAEVAWPEIVSCWVAPDATSNAFGETEASKPGTSIDAVQ